MGPEFNVKTTLAQIQPLSVEDCLDYALVTGKTREECRMRYIAAMIAAKFGQRDRDKMLDEFDELADGLERESEEVQEEQERDYNRMIGESLGRGR